MNHKKPIFNSQPDLKVLFQFNGKRRYTIADGFCADHLITDGKKIHGKHNYYCSLFISPNGRSNGTITFLKSEKHIPCLRKDDTFPIYDGDDIIGHALVLHVLNPALAIQSE